MEAHWVLVEAQRKQILVAVAAVIAVAMPVANPVNQMHVALLDIRVVVAARVGQHLTLSLQRTRKVSAQVTVCSLLLPRKNPQFPRQCISPLMVGTRAFMFRGLRRRIRKPLGIELSGARHRVRSPM
jgi:hypothetical protein